MSPMKWPLVFIVVFLLLSGVFYVELCKNREITENNAACTAGTAVMDLEKEAYKV
ncbi:hypothetical protein TK0530 [Thermococcus kodakarensis KOD1]|uniref:Uncharacterized protein n=1 Tax=Thermococcus kodakarensis (strain ATCC BAA-918 / JCM 12380 / KOD1) TaxID=69014 RepID=Q5JF04_THEKO|nr:hypothetical protein [Thermococcus kodakarensis]WCN28583.1 hypothetical protein POG15_02720 [Thermococcus kodakarensis]WCN30880.1 hypothetical protein POG21_02720 [Thermococcus kodakarensis]BAD84719.1 hypothetical protein TK0530 [Thermococcus kodakarensis KOD1]